MTGNSPAGDHPINALSTPDDWSIHCICRAGIHHYGERGCLKDVRWLSFNWRLKEDAPADMMRELKHSSHIHRDTLTALFGSDIFFTLFNLISVRAKEKYTPEDNWNTYAPDEANYIKALKSGYPALSHLYEMNGLRDNKHNIRNWAHPISQKTFKCLLLGMDQWLSMILQLSPIEKFLAFNVKIKSNPHIRTGDLPCLQFHKEDPDMQIFLSGPAWNFSLEYLYKLVIGLDAIKPLAYCCDNRLFIKSLHQGIGNKLFKIVNELSVGQQQYASPPSVSNPGPFDDLPLDLIKLIHAFAIDPKEMRKISARINRITRTLQTWELSADTEQPPNEASDDEDDEYPEPSPSPSPPAQQTSSRLKRAWRFVRRKK